LVTAAAAGVASLLLGVGLHAVLQSIGVAVFVAVATVWRTDYPFRLSTVEFSSFQAYRNTCSLFGRMGIVERTPA